MNLTSLSFSLFFKNTLTLIKLFLLPSRNLSMLPQAVPVNILCIPFYGLSLSAHFFIPTDSLLLVFLHYSRHLREFCGLDKIRDASKLTRFKQDFLIEEIHILLKMILPKGIVFTTLTQWQVKKCVNHINSYVRKELDGHSPYVL